MGHSQIQPSELLRINWLAMASFCGSSKKYETHASAPARRNPFDFHAEVACEEPDGLIVVVSGRSMRGKDAGQPAENSPTRTPAPRSAGKAPAPRVWCRLARSQSACPGFACPDRGGLFLMQIDLIGCRPPERHRSPLEPSVNSCMNRPCGNEYSSRAPENKVCLKGQHDSAVTRQRAEEAGADWFFSIFGPDGG